MAALLPGCTADVRPDVDAGGGGGELATPPACGGALGREPSVLASGLEASSLLLDGDHLILAGQTGSVLRIDRCNGAQEVLAERGAPVSVAIDGDTAFVAVESPPELLRVPLDGQPITTVAELPGPGRIAALADGRVYAVLAVPDPTGGDEDGSDDVVVVAVDPGSGAVTELLREELWLPGTWSLLGASRAGLYVRNGSYHGGNPGLLRVPLDGGPPGEIEGTHGAVDVAVLEDHLVIAGEAEENGMGSGRMEIARFELDGSGREALVPESAEVGHVQRVAADTTLVCWPRATTIRCAAPDVGAPIEDRDSPSADGWIEDLAVSPDAVYWLHRRDRDGDGVTEDVDLVAATR